MQKRILFIILSLALSACSSQHVPTVCDRQLEICKLNLHICEDSK